MSVTQKIDEYLKQTGIFFLSTEDGAQPKCRPLGFYIVLHDKVYFGVGTFKDVYKQMQENPNVEICASKPDGFLRIYGKAVFEKDYEIATAAFEKAPFLKNIYNDETGYKLGIFHIEGAAEFRSMMKVEESFAI